MRRVEGLFWPDYQNHLERTGLVYNQTILPDGTEKSYWCDGAYYRFTRAEVEKLDEVGALWYQMCIEAGDYAIENQWLGKMGIPRWAWDAVQASWLRHNEDGDPAVYGRFDVRWGGETGPNAGGPPKLLEYNADTPTSLLESAVTQYEWFKWQFSGITGVEQWNELEEKLVPAWERNAERAFGSVRRHYGGSGHYLHNKIHFAFTSLEKSGEDLANTACMQAYAEMAGYQTKLMYIEDVEYDQDLDVFLDKDGEEIHVMFKLHPWEWMASDKYDTPLHELFGKAAVRSVRRDSMAWIEPMWKMLWSNKGLLVALWERYRDEPDKAQYLLPAYFGDSAPERKEMGAYVAKPLLAREGADLLIFDETGKIRESGIQQGYGREGYVVQQLAELPNFHSKLDGDHHPVLGVWTVEDAPAGLGIRESDGLITNNLSSFVPHIFEI